MNPTDWINSYKESFNKPSLESYEIEAIERLTKAFDKYGDGDVNKLAYIFATTKLETQMGRYDTELGSNCVNYEGNSILGNSQSGDGCRYKGRGLPQLTGRRNYTLASQHFKTDYIGNPQLLASKKHSAKVAVWGMMDGVYTTKKLADYINSSKVDFVNARRVVNGLDKAQTIAGYATILRNNYKPTFAISGKQKILLAAFVLVVLMGMSSNNQGLNRVM
jgi:predicted chitinase